MLPKQQKPDDEAIVAMWRWKAEQSPILPRRRPCFDCAVICGFYQELIDDLKTQPRDVQVAVARTWSCHNGGGCRGALSALEIPDE